MSREYGTMIYVITNMGIAQYEPCVTQHMNHEYGHNVIRIHEYGHSVLRAKGCKT